MGIIDRSKGKPVEPLETHVEYLVASWRFSHKELLRGRIDSLGAAKERRLIMREADELGVLDEFMKALGKRKQT
jgi:hypothetical protein